MLSYVTLMKLYEGAPTRLYRKNAIIFDTFDESRGLYYIVDGNVKLSVVSGTGRGYTAHTLGPGDLLPLLGYFLGDRRPVLYTATTDVQMQWRWRKEVDEFCDQNPEALREIIRVVLDTMMSRVNTLSLHLSEQRVLLRIQELAKPSDQQADAKVALDITQQELADAVNLSRESVSGILNRLEEQQIVSLERNRLLVQVAKVDHAIALEL